VSIINHALSSVCLVELTAVALVTAVRFVNTATALKHCLYDAQISCHITDFRHYG
jgi:hypothetical protein